MSLKKGVACALLASASIAAAAPKAPSHNTIRYASPPAWTLPPPAPTTLASTPDAPVRIVYLDNQVHLGPAGEEQFSAYRVKILKPEALQAGNISLTWSPYTDTTTVHFLRVIRDGKRTDVLAANRFRILQREGGLEQSMLDGRLTATLQVPGLQVGDELEFAATIVHSEPALGGHVAGAGQLPVLGMPGAFRLRLMWPQANPVRWQATKDLSLPGPRVIDGQKVLAVELDDPKGSLPTEGAPPRFNMRRLVEYSDFASWNDVSRQFWPLFDKAASLPPASPLKAEAARIAAASKDPAARAEAALQLVQDGIRYVYVGLNGGNYTPAAADETWKRRFGDCKAKTAILIALLRELGIEAQPVLVSSNGGDGIDERLPNPGAFDHVLVRAQIAGRGVWLDGTRLGDRHLDLIPPLPVRWVLPLDAKGAALERVEPARPRRPQFTAAVDIDARKGLDQDANVHAQHIMRGDDAYGTRTKLAALSAEDADRAIRGYFHSEYDWVDPSAVSWRYDERNGLLVLDLKGTGRPGWKGETGESHSLTLLGAGFFAPDTLKRPKEQDQAAAWLVEFPRFRCWATTVRLPLPSKGMAWTYYAEPVNQRLAGVIYWRASGLQGNVVRTVMSREAYLPEIAAADASSANGQIAKFNNNMSSVFETTDLKAALTAPLPFDDQTDWATAPDLCSASASHSATSAK